MAKKHFSLQFVNCRSTAALQPVSTSWGAGARDQLQLVL